MSDQARVQVLAEGAGQAPSFEVLAPGELDGSDRFGRMLAGELGGVILTGLFTEAEAAAVVRGLRSNPGDSGPLDAAPFPGSTWGQVLVVSRDLGHYLRRARGLEAALAALGVDLGGRIQGGLTALGGGRPVQAPPAEGGQTYAPLTVRALPAGLSIGIHSERADWPSMAGLVGRIDPHRQLSSYVTLAKGQGGGELRIFHRPPPGREPALDRLSPEEGRRALAAFGLTAVRPAVGDLLLFDGGRYNHEVTANTAGERWTVGCFASQGADGARWAWS